MVRPKSISELVLMRKSGKISAKALKACIESVKAGITGLELDKIALGVMESMQGERSYKTVPGYKFATCVTINEQVVHGIPTDRKIKEGDIVSIDLATMYKGWHTDCAWTVIAPGERKQVARSFADAQDDKVKFLRVGEEALWLGVEQATQGNTVGDIGAAIQGKVEGAGYKVVRSLVGHGVGAKLHEEPEVPGYGKKGTGLVLEAGMTLAIEVIYAKGTSEILLEKDGWTYSSADGSMSGLFEMSVVVGKKKADPDSIGAEVLTDFRGY